jgi:hypothetical protein
MALMKKDQEKKSMKINNEKGWKENQCTNLDAGFIKLQIHQSILKVDNVSSTLDFHFPPTEIHTYTVRFIVDIDNRLHNSILLLVT